MTGKLTILDRSGHTEVAFDTEVADTITEAQRILADHLTKGGLAYRMTDEKTKQGEVVTDLVEGEIILAPRMVGG